MVVTMPEPEAVPVEVLITEYCEWNPERGTPATMERTDGTRSPWVRHGCPQEATVSLGRGGNWHLCETCATLPAFRRYRVRKALKTNG